VTSLPRPLRRSLLSAAVRVAAPLLGLFVAVGLWWLAIEVFTQPGSIQSRLAPGDGLTTLVQLTADGEIVEHGFASLRRILGGLLVAAAVGIPVGLALGSSALLARTSGGVFGILRNISPLAWTPIAIIFIGVGDAPVVFLIAMGAMWPIMMNTQAGVANLDPTWLRVSRSLGATRLETLRHVIWPGVRSNVLTGVRVATGLAWVILVPAEMLGVDSGLGYFILDARDRFRYDELIAVIIAIGLLGLVIDGATRYLLGGRRRRARRSARDGRVTRAPAGTGTTAIGPAVTTR
jgi:NitT/TauT family transport system permease protein